VDSPSHTVLVVDDDAAIRFLCRVNLEFDGWTVHEAGAIEQARQKLEAAAVDFVLLDVMSASRAGSTSSRRFEIVIRAFPSCCSQAPSGRPVSTASAPTRSSRSLSRSTS